MFSRLPRAERGLIRQTCRRYAGDAIAVSHRGGGGCKTLMPEIRNVPPSNAFFRNS